MLLPIVLAPPEPYVLANPNEARFEYAVPGVPVGVTVDRHGTGRVWRYGRPSTLLSTFQIEPVDRGAGNAVFEPPIVRASAGGGRALVSGQNYEHPSLQVIQTRPFRILFRRADRLDRPEAARWSLDGRTLLLPRQNGTTLLLDDAGRVRATLRMSPPFAFGGGRVFGLGERGFAVAELAGGSAVRRIAVRTAEPPFGVSPDGRWIVAGGRDRSGGRFRYHVWRVADGREMAEIVGQGSSYNSPLDPLFLGNDRFALVAMGEIRSLPTGRLVRRASPSEWSSWGPVVADPAFPLAPMRATFPPSPEGLSRLWPLPDGRLIATGLQRTLVLDPAARRAWTLPQFPTNGVRQAVRRADGTVVLNGLNGVRILDPTLRTARFVHQPKDDGLFGSSESILDPGGLTAVRGGMSAVRWRIDDGRVLGPVQGEGFFTPREVAGPDGARYRLSPPLNAVERVGGWSHRGPGYLLSRLSFTADGGRVAFVEGDPSARGAPRLRVLDAHTGASILDAPAPVGIDMAISPDGSRVAFLQDQEVEIRPLDGGPATSIHARMPASGELAWWGPDRLLLSGGTLQLLDARAGRLVSTWASWPDGAWAAWTPEGAADGDPRGLARIVRLGERPMPVGRPVRPGEVWRTLESRG